MARICENIFKTDTLKLSKCKDGFWLYDETRGMNLAMRAETERAALLEALEYYQKRLKVVEESYSELNKQVFSFVDQFVEEDERGY